MASEPVKKDVASALLSRGSAFVYLDPRKGGVVVPRRLKSRHSILLEFGHEMAEPIPDLDVSAFGISGTLRFKGEPFACFVPWRAVFALADADDIGFRWPADFPPEMRHTLEPAAVPEPLVMDTRPVLTLIKGGRDGE